MAWVVHISNPEQPGKLLPYAFVGLVGSGLAELIHPHAKKWSQSHGDVITDVAHASLSLIFSTLLRALLIMAFSWSLPSRRHPMHSCNGLPIGPWFFSYY